MVEKIQKRTLVSEILLKIKEMRLSMLSERIARAVVNSDPHVKGLVQKRNGLINAKRST